MTKITVELVHPIGLRTVQSWTFESSQTAIKIGRSPHNDIVLFSGVVSREHAMLRFDDRTWTLQSLGTNGCYRNDKLVRNPVISDGDIFRVAKTGPRLRVRIEANASVANSPERQQAMPLAATQKPPRSRLRKDELLIARETWLGPTTDLNIPTVAVPKPESTSL